MADQLPTRRTQGNRGNLTTHRGSPFNVLRNQFDELFDRFFGNMPIAPFDEDFGSLRMWDFDVSENDKQITVRAELPGFEPDDLQVEINNNVLTIEAKKRTEDRGEVSYRDFRRTVTLPQGVDPQNVQANYRHGVLELHIPRSESARGRRIPIQAEPKEGAQAGNKDENRASQREGAQGGSKQEEAHAAQSSQSKTGRSDKGEKGGSSKKS